ncbi:hypothetical protein C1645_839825, partial [Glomus cerebriforme]
MSFRRPHPRQRRTCKEHKAELEEENYYLCSGLQTEVDSNRQNEKRIRELERDYARCESEIQSLNGEIERLENASEEEISELKSEISSLNSQLYQAKKDVRDKEKYIASLEKRLVESEEQVEKLRCRIRTISSRKNSPERGNSPDLYNPNINLEMATITELANAIDGFVDNNTTARVILQRRRYDAEAERDLAIAQKNLAEGTMARVIDDLHQLQTIAQNQDDSIPDFLAKFRLYLQNQTVDPADNAGGPPIGREVAIGYLRGWQANLVAVNRRTAVQIGNQALNEAFSQPGTAIVKLRAVENPWNEDWRIAGGRPTNIAVNAPNANNVKEELRDLMYGTIRKGDMTIDELYRKILRIGRRANYRPEELRRKFLDALPLPWLEKAEDIAPQQQGITQEDMEKALVQQKTEYQSLMEKQKNEFKAQMAQQSIAQKAQASAPQPITIKPQVATHAFYIVDQEGNYIDPNQETDYHKYIAQAYNSLKRPQRNNNSARFDRIKEGLDETRDAVNQLNSQFQKLHIHKPVARSNFNRDYFKPITPINFQNTPPGSDNEGDGYDDDENNTWIGYDPPKKKQALVNDKLSPESSQPETYDELFPKLSPAMRKMCLSRKALEEKSKKDE